MSCCLRIAAASASAFQLPVAIVARRELRQRQRFGAGVARFEAEYVQRLAALQFGVVQVTAHVGVSSYLSESIALKTF
jgi:hypothetical protein